jgi:CopG family nickel-responsive transcriptional regulator
MSGTINLVYDHSVQGLQKQLADLQHEHINEVISSLHVHLMNTQTMEVILVQGPGSKLQNIADKMQVCRGVLSATLQVATSMMPPLHPLPNEENIKSQRREQETQL